MLSAAQVQYNLDTGFVYLVQVCVGQQMQLSRLEAILTFTLVENIRLEFPARVFFRSRHYNFF